MKLNRRQLLKGIIGAAIAAIFGWLFKKKEWREVPINAFNKSDKAVVGANTFTEEDLINLLNKMQDNHQPLVYYANKHEYETMKKLYGDNESFYGQASL